MIQDLQKKYTIFTLINRQSNGGIFYEPKQCISRKSHKETNARVLQNFVSDPDIFMDMSKYFEYQYSPERIDRYWETRKKPKDRKDFFVLLESEVIGELALKHIDFEKKECELSIHLQNDSVKNKGYGSAAERLALAYAFENLGMESVLADSVLKNTRSQHVLEKVGFVLIGVDDTFKYYRCDKNAFKKCT